MNLSLDTSLINNYKSPTQQLRVMTEAWVGENVYCPSCGDKVEKYPNNRPVGDFACEKCLEDFELKSKKDKFGSLINNGAYRTMIERLKCVTNPNFYLLNYDQQLQVTDFMVIPKHFFTVDMVIKRRPLAQTARRAGWVGCNLSISAIQDSGKIYYLKSRSLISKENVKKQWEKTLFLREELPAKGWLLDIMKCIEQIGNDKFELSDVYSFEDYLSKKHPDNKHVRAKIRQQLQILRDKGYLEFLSQGKYTVKSN